MILLTGCQNSILKNRRLKIWILKQIKYHIEIILQRDIQHWEKEIDKFLIFTAPMMSNVALSAKIRNYIKILRE